MTPVPRPFAQVGWFATETGFHADDDGGLPSLLPVGGLMAIGHDWGEVDFYDTGRGDTD
jgi:hypothetical protein